MAANIATTEQPQTSFPAQMINVIERVVLDPTADVEKLDRLLDVQERIMAKQSEMDFYAAMNTCQREMGRIATDATNPQTRSRYATYAKLDQALRPIYTNHGLSLSYDTEDPGVEGSVKVVCYVSHISGYTKKYSIVIDASGKGAKGNAVMTATHAQGAASSYGMRYLLRMIFNVAIGEDDNDGNVESEKSAKQRLELDEALSKIAEAKTEKGVNQIAKVAWAKFTDKESRSLIQQTANQRKEAIKNESVPV